MRCSLRTLSVSVVMVVAACVTAARGADEKADALKAKVLEAYKDTKQTQCTVLVSIHQKKGRWVSDSTTDVQIAFDRAAKRLLVDKAEMQVLIDGGKAKVKSDQIPGSYAELDFPSEVLHDELKKDLFFLLRPPLPELVLLTSPDPLTTLNDDKPPTVSYLEPDAGKRPGLRYNGSGGVTTLRIDPESNLVSSVIIEANAAELGGHDGDTATLTYTTTTKKHNQPLDAAVFAYDTTGLKAAKSMKEWTSPAGGEGQEGEGEAHANAMEGKPAPAVELSTLEGKPFKLSEEKAKVVVLDFWATWCPPCRRGLPVIQKTAEWAAAEKLSVAVYTVNLRETPDEVRKFLADNKLTLTVLMDTKGDVGQAYNCDTIPHTVIIMDGKVLKVHEGFSPTMEEELKKEITAALAPPK